MRVTDANPQLADFAWPAGKVLIDYTNSKGQRLQGTLTLPANYEPGKRYPMLVYFYEIMSNTHHRFSMPVYDDRPHISTYASDGYLVFQPDVVYQIGRPGTSAVDCVTSAVKKVIELGYADPARIGLQGHSWGGYQSSYILTQTDMFAAVVTGAPPTNLVSFYNELYKQTGTVQQGIMEVGQVRMGRDSTPWTAHEQYEHQSPVHNVQNITTPFLILHGTADGAVDWHQGLEYFNAARRNGKEVILLSYPDEPHHLGRKENQKDFQVRMKQFFDHYLKGTPAPRWMTEGVPQVRKGAPIE
jgi:dipeptidyl aminopeptidase/acylaminoacyl peptidase